MERIESRLEALGVAFIELDQAFQIQFLSPAARVYFDSAIGNSLFNDDTVFLDEEYKRIDVKTLFEEWTHKDGTECIECGLSVNGGNVNWVKLFLSPFEGGYLLNVAEQGELVATRRLNRQLSMQDPHTGLLYREAFLNRLYQEFEQGIVCCVRICNYQRINEIWGNAVANLVFMEILARVTSAIDQAICSKHSTDTFNVFVPSGAHFDIESFYSILNEPFHFNGRHFFSNVALGYYIERPGDVHEQSLNKAEMAILDVLSERVRLCEFQEELAKQIEHQNTLENEFRAAINQEDLNQSFHLVFQPVHNANSGYVTGVECLIRWKLHDKFVSPMEFIPIAEKIGDIGLLTQFNIEKLSELLEKLKRENINTSVMLFALNISVVEILDVEFVSKLVSSMEHFGIDPKQVKLELTESALIDNFNYVNQILGKLQELGFKISIDDFGTGFSSLSYLCRLRFDEIKIDRAFVTHVIEDEKLQTVFNSIASLATNLHKPVVAEGVETKEQLDYAKLKSIDYIQGYYFSKPLLEQELIDYLHLNTAKK